MSDSGPVKLPGLFALRTDDTQLNNWAQLVQETLETRNGSRGNALEASATQRDVAALNARIDALPAASSVVDITTLVDQLLGNATFMAAVTAALPSAEKQSYADEIATLQAQVDALQRQIQSTGSSGSGTYFEYVQATSTTAGYWKLKGSIGLAASTVTDTMDTLFNVFYSDSGDTLHGTKLNYSLRTNGYQLKDIANNAMNPMGTGSTSAELWAYAQDSLRNAWVKIFTMETTLAGHESRMVSHGI